MLLPEVTAPNKIGPYHLQGHIGAGAFSVVRLAVQEETGQTYACKIVSKRRLIERSIEESFEKELAILEQLDHPHIIKLTDFLKDSLNYYFVMEVCREGTLYQRITETGKMGEEEAKHVFFQLAEAVNYMHVRGVAHRDLKPENVLISADDNIKVIDFGLSKAIDTNSLMRTKCGTPVYASPECLSGKPYDGPMSDAWSCGVILYVMVCGEYPWTKTVQKLVIDQIMNGDYFVSPSLSEPLRELITGLLETEIGKRWTLQQALECRWLSDVRPIAKRPIPLYEGVAKVNTSMTTMLHRHTANGELKLATGKILLQLAKRKTTNVKTMTLHRVRRYYSASLTGLTVMEHPHSLPPLPSDATT